MFKKDKEALKIMTKKQGVLKINKNLKNIIILKLNKVL